MSRGLEPDTPSCWPSSDTGVLIADQCFCHNWLVDKSIFFSGIFFYSFYHCLFLSSSARKRPTPNLRSNEGGTNRKEFEFQMSFEFSQRLS